MNLIGIKKSIRKRLTASQWDRLFEWICTIEALFGRHERRVRVARNTVRNLERKLWSGFHQSALEDLEQYRRDAASAPWLVALASFAQARWYADAGEWEHVAALLDAVPPPQIDHATALRYHLLRIEALIQTGRFAMAAVCLQQAFARYPGNVNLRLVEMNLLARQRRINGPKTGSNDDRTRLDRLNRHYRAAGLEPLALNDPDAPLDLDNLTAGAGKNQIRQTTGPLVSVLMPAFNAQSTLGYAVHGLLEQTYANLEILIVDDASSDRTHEIAEDIARRDERVRVLCHDQNRGAHAARNTALACARGEFVTVHDSDDWSHPQMLGLQIERLRNDERALAVFTRLCRVRDGLLFQLRPYRPMLEPIHWNLTSMLLKGELLRELGGWDPVLAQTDAELVQRLRAHVGRQALVEVHPELPLSFFRQATTCITEQDHIGIRTLHAGSCGEYDAQARYWRDRTSGASCWPATRPRKDGNTPFYVPMSLRPNAWKCDTDYDVILVSNLNAPGGTRRCNLAYIAGCTAMGFRVGIVNYPRYRDRDCGAIQPDYRQLLQSPCVDLLTAQDTASCRLLIVHHPPLLQYHYDALPSIHSQRQLLLVNQLPVQTCSYSEVLYSPVDVDQRFEYLFGGIPEWVPISGLCRRFLERDLGAERLYPEDWIPTLHPDFPIHRSPRIAEPDRAPVLGRHSRDHWTKWPAAAATTLQAYGTALNGRVRLLGGCAHSPLKSWHIPGHWEIIPFDGEDVANFLDSIDIFVHFPHEDYIEEFGRNVMEAMAAGVPCILPETFRENFGDAARYCAPDEVAAVAEELWSHAEMYEAMSQRGLAFVNNHCTPACAERRLRGVLMEQADATR